ncbi:MAG: hypothetical protein A3K66_02800 [Euryarchaeota archaeon RBG_16_67_27]|nr:MAG: hypothetical protein A3K66_02800 [Euryarchaeota archaeon RBG_16_67_27]
MTGLPKTLSTRRIRDEWPPISVDEVELPSGERRDWIRLHFGVSAAVLAMTKDGRVLITRGYRHGLGRAAYGLPGGIARTGEAPEACARRELLEETGHEAARLLPLYEGNNLGAYLEGALHLFFAKDCLRTDRAPDPNETEDVETLTIRDALDRARRGEFESSVVTLAILLADARGWLAP